jgi:hypothetical protein
MVEALYFQTYHSFLIGNFNDTKMFFEFLVDEFKKKKDPKALSNNQLKELKIIRSALQSGKIETQQWINEPEVASTGTGDAPDIKQTELVRLIHYDGLQRLQELLQAPDLELYNIEHPCGSYGAVDMVYRSKDTIYPLEVKRHEGKHDLIGQISKYTLHFKLGLILKHYEIVQPVTICNSYNQHTLTELKRLFVIPIRYTIFEEKIRLNTI